MAKDTLCALNGLTQDARKLIAQQCYAHMYCPQMAASHESEGMLLDDASSVSVLVACECRLSHGDLL